jgi:sec-independent protein translocase protein TatA
MIGFGLPGSGEWIVILIVGLLVFGRRLPEVARGLGRSVTEFKRGLAGIGDEIDREAAKRPALPPARQGAEAEPTEPHDPK